MFPRFGVIIFFVHTSLVLLFSLRRLELDGGGRNVARFYLRRIFRIYPLSMLCVLAVVAASVPRWPPTGEVVRATPAVLISNLLLLQNLIPLPSVTAPLWSLPFEMQMYLVLPVCYWVVESRKRSPLFLYVGFFALLALPVARLHLIVPYVPCFLGGVLAYQLAKSVRPRFGWQMLSALLVVCCGVYTWGGNELLPALDKAHPSWTTPLGMLWDWACATAVGILIGFFGEVSSRIVRKASHTIAKYSYGIYLSHLSILWLAFDRMSAKPAVVQWSTFVVLTVAIPVVTFHLVEDPLIRFGGRVANKLRNNYRPVVETATA